MLDGGAQIAYVQVDGSFVFNQVRVAVAGSEIFASMHADGTNWNAGGPELTVPLLIPARGIFDPFTPRPKISLWSLVMANPMVLMMGGVLALFFFLPKVMDGMDPEELKKIQESRNTNPQKIEMPDVSEQLANWFAPAAATPTTTVPAASTNNTPKKGKGRK
ncbi:hypothetical protein HK100_004531 [Physocladia obscura]|uniref:ER membrane protein complex subunit 7 beta-sandwich domain-containing protein n=1 Tax=Physocladia obscura TaxID=109957 RepID=A0AAD5T8X4_9FUNG|nr:hypothetical protein HK100_004531 [Physocladia obscura]